MLGEFAVFYFNKPTTSLCDEMARKLILKYPFVKDDLGNGYVSFLTAGQREQKSLLGICKKECLDKI